MTSGTNVLFGKYLSPYVRRVAVSLNMLRIPFEQRVISAIGDEAEREAVNPVGRVPALRLPSGEVLVDSAAILDHFDEVVGPEQALIPVSGMARRRSLQLLAIATGAIDRAMTANAERRREVLDHERIARLLRQCRQGFAALEHTLGGEMSFEGTPDRVLQSDITTVVGFYFVNHIFPGTLDRQDFPGLGALSDTLENRAEFRDVPIETIAR